MTRALNVALVLLITTIVGLHLLVRADPARPNYRVPTNMADSAAYHSFAPNPVFPDGKTLQESPRGAIARDHLPLHYSASPEDAARAGAELLNPLARNPAPHLERGAALYASFCQPCHGPGGLGDGPVTRRGVPPPPSLLADNARCLADGRVFHVLTYGQNNMPSYAAQIAREDRWRIILYLRSLQGQLSATGSAATSPASQPAQPTAASTEDKP